MKSVEKLAVIVGPKVRQKKIILLYGTLVIQGPPKYAFFRALVMLFSRWSYAFYAFKTTKLCLSCFHNLRAVLTIILDFLKKIELNSLI